MPQLSDLRTACRGEYLGDFTLESDPDFLEDARFTNDLLNHLLNDAHRELAVRTKLYRQTKTFDLQVGADGISYVGLGADVISVIPGSVRRWDGNNWQRLREIDEDTLLSRYGPLDSATNGTPNYFYLRAGSELGEERMLVLYPGSDTAYASGLRVGCWVYPVLMDNDTDTPAFAPAEHQWLVAQVTAKMAAIEEALKGNGLAITAAKAQQAEEKLRQASEEGRRSGPPSILYEGW